jgi:thiamine-monophosphate kinase
VTSTLRALGEVEAIRRLLAVIPAPAGAARAAAAAAAAVVIGAGDDAAVVRPRAGYDLLATTDTMLEGVHFVRDWIDAGALGARLAEANLSDVAAMAAEPRWALVSFGARADHDVEDLIEVQRGLVTALARHGAAVAGGNLTAVSAEEWLTLTLLGEVQAGRAWTRSGARPGDLVAVSGRPGRAGAGSTLAARRAADAGAPQWGELIEAWRRPSARVELALALARTGAVTAAIDISDGVSSDLAHLCRASGVGARLDAGAWPEDAPLESAAAALGTTADALRLGPSDDYELLLAVDPAGRAACARIAASLGSALTFVGALTATPGRLEWMARDGSARPIQPSGYDHFASRAKP